MHFLGGQKVTVSGNSPLNIHFDVYWAVFGGENSHPVEVLSVHAAPSCQISGSHLMKHLCFLEESINMDGVVYPKQCKIGVLNLF